MCPLFYLLLLFFCLSPLLLLCSAAAAVVWKAKFQPTEVEMFMKESSSINLTLDGIPEYLITGGVAEMQLTSDDTNVAETKDIFQPIEVPPGGSWSGEFNCSGSFMGSANIYVQLKVPNSNDTERSEEKLHVVVMRNKRTIDYVFAGSVATLVSILYINFGAALDLSVVRSILVRPIGPGIGCVGQFLFMPLFSYLLGFWLFNDNPELWLGLFFTGVSPGGGASNIWTIILGGNIHLSIAMTAISTLAMFGMLPFWLFTLGKSIFDKANLVVPYSRIASFAIGLIVPLGIGLLIQRYLPRVARVLVRILKPLSVLLILFIIIFAIVTNLYLFQLFSWQITIAGLGLPWAGYIFGYGLARLFRQVPGDALAIALETGIQNTGIAIFLLSFALLPPWNDLTVVVPVSVAIMTPFPLLALYIVQKIRDCVSSKQNDKKGILDDNHKHSPSQLSSLENEEA